MFSIFTTLIVGFVIYCGYAWLSFNPAFKSQSWIVFACLACALLGNLLWIFLAKATADNHRLLLYGLWWDAMITTSTILIPILFFGVRFSYVSGIGLVITVIGLIIMKISMLNT